MPENSRFFAIVIRMFYAEHNPPHFHAEYAGKRPSSTSRAMLLTDVTPIPLRSEALPQRYALVSFLTAGVRNISC